MWKVLVVICTLDNPCTMFQEDPIKWYNTEADCMKAAEVKAAGMLEIFSKYDYFVESEAHSCLYVFDQNQA